MSDTTKQKKTVASSDELVVKRRQLSWVVAGALLSCFSVFMVGFFWGQNKAVERFVEKADRDSFADQLYYSLCSLYDVDDEPAGVESSADQESAVVMELAAGDENAAGDEGAADEAVTESPVVAAAIASEESSEYQYYAELIGFGTPVSAQKFAKKLLGKGMPVEVHKRRSKTAKGKIVFWYQVATEKHTDYAALEQLVDRVKKEEYIQDVRIIRC